MYDLATQLRVLRAERGITLAQAEELTGVTRETLGELEKDNKRTPYMPTLSKIARGYGIPVRDLLEALAREGSEDGS